MTLKQEKEEVRQEGCGICLTYPMEVWLRIVRIVSIVKWRAIFPQPAGNRERLYISSGSSLSRHITLSLNVDDIIGDHVCNIHMDLMR